MSDNRVVEETLKKRKITIVLTLEINLKRITLKVINYLEVVCLFKQFTSIKRHCSSRCRRSDDLYTLYDTKIIKNGNHLENLV